MRKDNRKLARNTELPELLTAAEAASFLRLSPITLSHYRYQGRGPVYRKHGWRVFYSKADLVAWSERQRMGFDGRADPDMNRRRVLLASLGVAASVFLMIGAPADRLIWNRTGSAPEGLYWLSDEPFNKGRWVVVSARSGAAQWAERQGFIGRDWVLLKQVAGVPGDQDLPARRADTDQWRSGGRREIAGSIWQGFTGLGGLPCPRRASVFSDERAPGVTRRALFRRCGRA